MNTVLPSDLHKLKAQFETWRRTRTKQTAIPDHLRSAAIALLDRYSASMICRVCRLHPRTLEQPVVRAVSNKTAPDFFPLPPLPAESGLFSALRQAPTDCRVLTRLRLRPLIGHGCPIEYFTHQADIDLKKKILRAARHQR